MKIGENKDAIAANAAEIANQSLLIAANTAAIATNKGLIDANEAAIGVNSGAIEANRLAIVANGNNIQANTDAIAKNTADIATNAAAISANTQLINSRTAANKALIDAFEADLNNLKAKVTYVKEEFFTTNDSEIRLYTGSESATGFSFCVDADETAEIVVNASVIGGKVDTSMRLYVRDSSGADLAVQEVNYK